MLISGKEKLERMRDGRIIYIGAERVDDVTRHGAFRNAARTIADLYDFKADPDRRDLFSFEENGERFGHGCAVAPARTLFAACAP
jgi:4-hydroxyphenylacetate 3-monooxygenase